MVRYPPFTLSFCQVLTCFLGIVHGEITLDTAPSKTDGNVKCTTSRLSALFGCPSTKCFSTRINQTYVILGLL